MHFYAVCLVGCPTLTLHVEDMRDIVFLWLSDLQLLRYNLYIIIRLCDIFRNKHENGNKTLDIVWSVLRPMLKQMSLSLSNYVEWLNGIFGWILTTSMQTDKIYFTLVRQHSLLGLPFSSALCSPCVCQIQIFGSLVCCRHWCKYTVQRIFLTVHYKRLSVYLWACTVIQEKQWLKTWWIRQ